MAQRTASMRSVARIPVLAITAVLIAVAACPTAWAEGYSYPGGSLGADVWEDAEYQVLIKNVNIFDGKTNRLIEGSAIPEIDGGKEK